MLKHIAKEITCGRPLWGLLWANEYLEPSDPMQAALVRRARSFIVGNDTLFERIAAGATKSQLSKDQLATLSLERGWSKPKQRKIVIPHRTFKGNGQVRYAANLR